MQQIQKPQIPIPQTKRLFKIKTKLQSKLQSFIPLTSLPHPNKYLTNTHLHVPGKINFHQLLSLPLEKQIQRQNSLKENQTFCLKFQPDLPTKQSFKHHSRDSLNKITHKINHKNSRFLNRKNFTAEKGTRPNNINQNEEVEQIKQAAKTMYFRPIGKIARDYEHSNSERKSVEFTRNTKSKQNHRLEIGTHLYKDKLLMLLQIRKQERNERKSKSSLGNEFNSYRQINKLSITESFKEKFDQSRSFRSYRKDLNEETGTLVKIKRGNSRHQQRQDTVNPSQLSPWFLMQNGEDF